MQRRKHQDRKLLKFRLIKYQEIWMLTIQGWLILITVLTISIFFIISKLYPFLAVNAPLKSADVLVVEGWISDYSLKKAAEEFKHGAYSQILTVGTNVDQGFYLAEYKNFAEISAATLQKMGIPKEKLIAIPVPEVTRNRTIAAAIAVQQYIEDKDLPVRSINLFTSDAHARRSWLIFKNTLAPKIPVGVIATNPPNYNSHKWWSSSEGVRVIMSEAIAYFYALFISWKV
ncbi:YdcF family protein [Nostoc sp. FACHB-110]|nr:YdcF family protein [Nostoc sp. FACHB-110]